MLGVGLGADIGPRSDPVSFVLIVFSTRSRDNRFFISLKLYSRLIPLNYPLSSFTSRSTGCES